MKITFLDISASYSHSSLALPMLERACDGLGHIWDVVRGTMNDSPGELALAVQGTCPDIVLSTFYLFTHDVAIKAIRRISVLCPDATIILGGPEFLGDNEAFLRTHSMVDCVVTGEGEIPLRELLGHLDDTSEWQAIPGISFFDSKGVFHRNSPTPAKWPPRQLPFESVFYDWTKPFIQVESSRGCNQACGFCTSAKTGGPHWLPIEDLRSWLIAARDHGISDIRLLDRTFNASPRQASERLNLFTEEFEDMHFHLEFHPAFLPESIRDILRSAPEGMFHLEVGIQSTSQEAGEHSQRAGGRDQVLEGLEFLCSCPGIQVHADLISGLPGSTYASLLDDLETLLQLNPDEIQLELLKVLPGTEFERRSEELDLLYAPDPPYEVLQTGSMSSLQIKDSALLSKLIDRFYNAPFLRPVFKDALVNDKDFLENFLSSIKSDLEYPISQRKRALLLDDYLSSTKSPARWTLAYQWLMKGYSPSQCPMPAERWKKDLPDTLEVTVDLGGTINPQAPVWSLQTPTEHYFFVFDNAITQNGPARVMRDLDYSPQK